MSLRGHYRQIIDAESHATLNEEPDNQLDVEADEKPDASSTPSDSPGVVHVTRDNFIRQVEHLMRRTRGSELPGAFNPMIVADLFREQCRPWESIARGHIEKVWHAASGFVKLVVAYAADESTTKALQHEVFEPALKRILREMHEKVTELLKPHQDGHPITYNHYFTETLQKVQRERKEKERER